MRLHHIGHITKSLSMSLELIKHLGFWHDGERILDPNLGAYLAFAETGQTRIELVEPLPGHKSLLRTLSQRPGPYHYAFELDESSNELIERVRNLRLVTIVEETEAVAFPEHLVSFYISRDGTVIEFLRRRDSGSISRSEGTSGNVL